MRSDDLSIQRTIELEVDAAELWRLISTSDGWAGWLVDVCDVEVASGASGGVLDGGVSRAVEIDEVDDHERRVSFRWRDLDDPAGESQVVIEQSPGVDGQRLVVIERRVSTSAAVTAGPRAAGARAAGARAAGARAAWEVRACSLWACTRMLIRA